MSASDAGGSVTPSVVTRINKELEDRQIIKWSREDSKRAAAAEKELVELRKKVKEWELGQVLPASAKKPGDIMEIEKDNEREEIMEKENENIEVVEKKNGESKKRKRGGTLQSERDAI